MKIQIQPTSFNPVSRQIDFSGTPGLDLSKLLLVANARTSAVLYDPLAAGCGGTLAGSVLTYEVADAGAQAGDPLIVIYDDHRTPAGDDTLKDVRARLDAPMQQHLYHPGDGRPVDRRRPLPVAEARPKLMKRGFRADELTLSWAGTASMKFDSPEGFTNTPYEHNFGNEHTVLYASVYNWSGYGGAPGSNYAITEFAFNGRALGFEIAIPGSGTPFAKFGVMIDGVAYKVSTEPPMLPQFVSQDAQRQIMTVMIADNLSPGWHHCQLHFPAHPSINQTWIIPRVILEENDHNRPHPAGSLWPRIAPVAIGTGATWTEITPRGSGYATYGLAITRVHLINTSGAAINVAYRAKMANGQAVTYPPSISVPAASSGYNGAVTLAPPDGTLWYQALEFNASAAGAYVFYEYRRA